MVLIILASEIRNPDMLHRIRTALVRRTYAGAFVLGTALTACAAQAATYTMYRDPGCG